MLHVFDDIEEVSQQAAKYFIETADIAIRERGRFSVALSGGNTPRTLYVLLAHAPFRSQVDWQRVHIFWGDERCVPPDDRVPITTWFRKRFWLEFQHHRRIFTASRVNSPLTMLQQNTKLVNIFNPTMKDIKHPGDIS